MTDTTFKFEDIQNISTETLQKRSIFLAAPCYGGITHGLFAKSVSDLSGLCIQHGIKLQLYFLFNESLIQRARNYCADEFLRSDCTHMLFIDADIGFNPQDVLFMLAMQGDDSPYDVLTGLYPKKTIAWEKIKAAVDKGVADEDPNALNEFVGDFVFNPIVPEGAKDVMIPLNQPVEVAEAGTGFMMIRRATYDKYREAYPEYLYKPDHIRTEAFDGTREIMAYFDCVIDPKTKRYLSEDYFFCYKAREAGMKVWTCPWIRLVHVGSYMFGGSLAALASIGVSPTADVTKVGRNAKQKLV